MKYIVPIIFILNFNLVYAQESEIEEDTAFLEQKNELFLNATSIGTFFPYVLYVSNNRFSLDNQNWENVGTFGKYLEPHLDVNSIAYHDFETFKKWRTTGIITQYGGLAAIIGGTGFLANFNTEVGLPIFFIGHAGWIVGTIFNQVVAKEKLKLTIKSHNKYR